MATDAMKSSADADIAATEVSAEEPLLIDAEGLPLQPTSSAVAPNIARPSVVELATSTVANAPAFAFTPTAATVTPGTPVLQATALPPLPIADAAPMLAEHIETMMEDEVWSMKLRLDPPRLGSVEVQLAVRDQQVAVSLGSGDAQARMLLAQALPELANALAARGLQLMGADVGQPSQGRDEAPARRLSRGNGHEEASGGEGRPPRASAQEGLLDHYA